MQNPPSSSSSAHDHPNNYVEIYHTSSPSVYIQQQSLQKLQCSLCQNLLSVFPIYRNAASESYYVICGRCPQDETSTLLFHDQLYESIAEFHKFPCINKKYGCLESLVPSKMIIHEKKNCLYKVYECFAKSIDANIDECCKWRGKLACLFEHFVMNHPMLILNECCRFEVDFITAQHSEKYLLSHAENLYIITKSWNSTTQLYSILLEYIGSNPSINQYSYEVILENTNRTSRCTIEEVIDEKIDIQLSTINSKLQDPITIIATVNIKKKRLNSDAADNYNLVLSDDDANINEETLKEVECPVCMMYFVPPVFQCLIGHSICKNCVVTLENCPTCHSTFSKSHNFALEAIIWNMIYPCKNSPRCQIRSKVKNLEKHEETCIYGPYKCPLALCENCKEEFPFFELYNHIQFSHYENLLKFDRITLPFDETFEEDILEGYILHYDELLFKLCFMYQNVEKRFLWSIQLIDSTADCTKYDFELEIIDIIGNNRQIYFKSKCAPYSVHVTAKELEENGVYLDFAQIRQFISNQLTYRIIIMKSSHY